VVLIDGNWICPVVSIAGTGKSIPVETGGELPQNFHFRRASKAESRRLGGVEEVAERNNFEPHDDLHDF